MHNINSAYCSRKCAEWLSEKGILHTRAISVPSHQFLPRQTKSTVECTVSYLNLHVCWATMQKKSISVILFWRKSFGNFLLRSLFSTHGMFRTITLCIPRIIIRPTTSRNFGSMGVLEFQRICIDLLFSAV